MLPAHKDLSYALWLHGQRSKTATVQPAHDQPRGLRRAVVRPPQDLTHAARVRGFLPLCRSRDCHIANHAATSARSNLSVGIYPRHGMDVGSFPTCADARTQFEFVESGIVVVADSSGARRCPTCLCACGLDVDCGGSSGEANMSGNAEIDEATRKMGRTAAIVVCWFLGNGSLIAWNSMLTIEDYYVKLFPRYHPTRMLTIVYQPFAFTTIAILAYHEARLNTRKRNLIGYSLFFISSVLLIVLDLGTSGRGGIVPFIGICIISAAFGVADGHVQGGMVGDLAIMHSDFIQSFLAGLAASGALTSALRLITKAAFEHNHDGLRKGAMLFFAVASLLELISLLLYAYVFPKLSIVKYYRSKAASEGLKTVSADLAAAGIDVHNKQEDEEDQKRKERLTMRRLLIENWDYALGMYLIYVLTLSIIPGFLSEDTGNHVLGSWYALVLITSYNVLDLIGRYTPLVKYLRIESRKWLLIAICSRFGFIPAFYFTAKSGGQGWMIMLTSLLGLSNGHLTVCSLTAAPKGYKGPEANALGNLLVVFLLGGLFSGVALDWLWLIGKGW
ncbi:Equilibrative nucleotide transporter 3 [Platanthera zijinensis]|uniref:Equilibrative nucleotide transporter 3 n=1 Tax=Platanthera zijinensis TaxID=2320716 RepID=A0AAP0BZL3_9ASPA